MTKIQAEVNFYHPYGTKRWFFSFPSFDSAASHRLQTASKRLVFAIFRVRNPWFRDFNGLLSHPNQKNLLLRVFVFFPTQKPLKNNPKLTPKYPQTDPKFLQTAPIHKTENNFT